MNRSKPFFSTSNEKILNVLEIGTIEYETAFKLQLDLQKKRQDEKILDTILLLEHNPVFTLGKRGNERDILVDKTILDKEGITIFKTDRGGQVTYHGPGQLVIYLIFHLHEQARELRRFVHTLERSVVSVLKEKFSINALPGEKDHGVWVENRKIAALGIAINHHVSRHGVAINVAPKMDHFNLIVPCGIKDKQVTSIRDELIRLEQNSSYQKKEMDNISLMREIKDAMVSSIQQNYGFTEVKETSSLSSLVL